MVKSGDTDVDGDVAGIIGARFTFRNKLLMTIFDQDPQKVWIGKLQACVNV